MSISLGSRTTRRANPITLHGDNSLLPQLSLSRGDYMVALVIIMVADILLTLSFAQIIGPVTFRFSHYGLPGTLFRAPFYLLRLYIGIAVLLFQRQRKWYLWGPVLGLALTLPMAFWATLPICPRSESWCEPRDRRCARDGIGLAHSSSHQGSARIQSRSLTITSSRMVLVSEP